MVAGLKRPEAISEERKPFVGVRIK
jgi:hypothetical protein